MAYICFVAPRNADTKEDILRLGTELIQLYGYNAFSYADIAKKLQIRNAAVHYHYPGKEDLLGGIIDNYIEKYHQLETSLNQPGITALQKLEAYMARYTEIVEQNKICIIGSVCSDYNTLPASVKERIHDLVTMVLNMVEKVLLEGKRLKQFHFSGNARTQTLLIMTNLAAGAQLSRITGKDDYLAICKGILQQVKA